MSRHGKIARLPRMIRDELNNRMLDGEAGGHLLKWLNELPEVKEVMARHFKGISISKQNLSQWRNGGFAEWRVRQEYRGDSDELAADAREIEAGTGGRLGDHLAVVLEARYASVLTRWNGEVSEGLEKKLKVLHGLCRDVAILRRGDHNGARLQLDRDQVELLRKRTDEEVLEHFQKWMENEKIRDWLCAHWPSPEERKRQLYAMYGMTPPGGESSKHQEPTAGEEPSANQQGGAVGEASKFKNQNSEKVQTSTSSFNEAGLEVGTPGEGIRPTGGQSNDNSSMKSGVVKVSQSAGSGSSKDQAPSSREHPSTNIQGETEVGTAGQGTRPTGGQSTASSSQAEPGSVKVSQTMETDLKSQVSEGADKAAAVPKALAGKPGGAVPRRVHSVVEEEGEPISAISYRVPRQKYQSPLLHPVLARLEAEREAKAAAQAAPVPPPVPAPVAGYQKKLGPVGGLVPLDQIPGSYGSFRSSS